MDDVTAKVLAETWGNGLLKGGLADVHDAVGENSLGAFGTLSVESASPLKLNGVATEADIARARIAACAPDALRLLLEAEEHDDRCPWCAAIAPRHEGHAPDCRWLALIVKAGLR